MNRKGLGKTRGDTKDMHVTCAWKHVTILPDCCISGTISPAISRWWIRASSDLRSGPVATGLTAK